MTLRPAATAGGWRTGCMGLTSQEKLPTPPALWGSAYSRTRMPLSVCRKPDTELALRCIMNSTCMNPWKIHGCTDLQPHTSTEKDFTLRWSGNQQERRPTPCSGQGHVCISKSWPKEMPHTKTETTCRGKSCLLSKQVPKKTVHVQKQWKK